MRIFALELDNGIRGIDQREEYIEGLISRLPSPELVVLPEMSLCGCMASQDAWAYADDRGRDTSAWAIEVARRYDTHLGVGYVDRDGDDYYNRYLVAGPEGVCGIVSKSGKGSSAFKGGTPGGTVDTPFGRVGIAIGDDAWGRGFYDLMHGDEPSLILFPDGTPADPSNPAREHEDSFMRCMAYVDAFGVPVVRANAIGEIGKIPGVMGRLAELRGFGLNGGSRIYAEFLVPIPAGIDEAIGADVDLLPRPIRMEIAFRGREIMLDGRRTPLLRQALADLDAMLGRRGYGRGKDLVGKGLPSGTGE